MKTSNPTTFTDHDVLVTLKANFDSFTIQYTKDIQELKDGTTLKINDHEKRISEIESKLDSVDIPELDRQVKLNKQDLHDAALQKKWFLGLAGLVGAVAYFIFQEAFRALHIFGK